jgi:hypothetical protein
MPIAMSVVPTGRRMNGREKFIAAPCVPGALQHHSALKTRVNTLMGAAR